MFFYKIKSYGSDAGCQSKLKNGIGFPKGKNKYKLPFIKYGSVLGSFQ